MLYGVGRGWGGQVAKAGAVVGQCGRRGALGQCGEWGWWEGVGGIRMGEGLFTVCNMVVIEGGRVKKGEGRHMFTCSGQVKCTGRQQGRKWVAGAEVRCEKQKKWKVEGGENYNRPFTRSPVNASASQAATRPTQRVPAVGLPGEAASGTEGSANVEAREAAM